jgi:flagellar basal-body rod protein FlgG
MRALDTAATGMAAMDLQVQVIAGNIANSSTTGFKSQRAEFQDLIYEHVQRIGAQASDNGNILPVGIELGSGVKTVGTPRLMTQGTLSQTGNTLDLAIQGSGWFQILMPDGTFSYTRDGSFQMDNQGRMVTAEGNLVQPTITIPPNSTGLTINAQGQVSVTLPGSTTSSILGQLQLTTFINDAGLQAQGSNLFVATPASGQPQNNTPGLNNSGTLLQGSLEQSNVSAVTEITNLIQAQRAYEMNSKVITAADQMLQTTAQLMR